MLQLAPSPSAVPGWQTPPWQTSAPLHALPSLHGVPLTTGACWHPNILSHESTVHGVVSAQLSGVPGRQTPPWHRSAPLQTSPSEQSRSVTQTDWATVAETDSTPHATTTRSVRTRPPLSKGLPRRSSGLCFKHGACQPDKRFGPSPRSRGVAQPRAMAVTRQTLRPLGPLAAALRALGSIGATPLQRPASDASRPLCQVCH